MSIARCMGSPRAPLACSRLWRLAKPHSGARKAGPQFGELIEVIEGLQPGEQIILSDMSQWDGHERVRLELTPRVFGATLHQMVS